MLMAAMKPSVIAYIASQRQSPEILICYNVVTIQIIVNEYCTSMEIQCCGFRSPSCRHLGNDARIGHRELLAILH